MENNIVIKNDITNTLKDQKIMIYGTGHVAMKFYKGLAIRGLEGNVLCFIVSKKQSEKADINGIPVKAIEEISLDEKSIICLAVHEVLKAQIEATVKKHGIGNYIWIYPYLFELVLGPPLKRNIEVPLTKILKRCDDYRIAIRYLAIENYFGKNSIGFRIYEKAQAAYCGEKPQESVQRSFVS